VPENVNETCVAYHPCEFPKLWGLPHFDEEALTTKLADASAVTTVQRVERTQTYICATDGFKVTVISRSPNPNSQSS